MANYANVIYFIVIPYVAALYFQPHRDAW